MKRALIAIPAVIVTLLAVLLVAPGFMDWNQYKEQATSQIRKTAGLEVILQGDLSLALIPSPRFYAENVIVRAPAGSAAENLAAIERLDVNIALMPLLGGQVSVSSIDLNKPDITLEILKSGEGNWMTPELKAMAESKSPGAAQGKMTQSISLQDVKIVNGSFRFLNTKTGQKSELSGINADVNAETLQGPFMVSGAFAFAGQDIEFKAKALKMEPGAQSVSLTGNAALPKSGMTVDYAGVVGTVAPFEIQGETAVKLSSLSQTLEAYGVKNNPFKSNTAELKGLVTASQESFSITNGSLDLGGQKFTADIKAALKPAIAVVSSLKAQESINIDAFMGQKTQAKPNAGLAGMTELVPQTISMPMALDASLEVSLPAAMYQGQQYSNLTIALVKKDKQFQGKVTAAGIPGKGSVDAGAALEYASQSASEKGGGVTFSEPALSVFLKAQSQNVAQSVAALSGRSDLPYVNKIKTGSVDLKAAVSPQKLQLTSSTAKLDDANFNIAGSFVPDGGQGRAKLSVDLTTDTLDIDKWKAKTTEGDAAKPGQDLGATLKAMALPYDVEFDIGIQNAKLEGQEIKGLRAQGALTRNAAAIKNISAQNFAGTALALSGQVADIQNLSGVDFKISADSQNIKTLAQTLGMKTDGLPKGLTAAKVTATGKGNASQMDVTADISAMGGQLITKGTVADPLGTPKIGNIHIQAKHPNTAQAIKIFAPDAPDYPSMNKPLDISTDVKQTGTLYSLENLNATVAGSKVDGSLSFDNGGAKPVLNGDLKFGDLVIQSAKTAVGSTASGVGGSPAAAKSGQWSSDPIDSGFLHSANANLSITANSIKYEAWDLSKPVLKLKLADGVLNVSQMESGLFGGQMAMTATVQSSAANTPLSIQNAAKFTNVNIESMAKALSSTSKVQGKGMVDMDWNIATTGASQSSLVSALKGSSVLKGRQLVLEGFDLAALATALMDSNKPLPRLQEIVTASTSGGQTAFDTLDGQYAISNGIVSLTAMAMDGPAASIASKGTVSLPQWFIDTSHMITLKNAREVAPFNVVIKGPLNSPGNTFGKGMFDSILRSKVQEKVMEKLPGLLGDSAAEKLQKFGILPTKQPAPATAPAAPPADVTPSSGEEVVPAPEQPAAQQQPVQQEPEEITPEKAFQGLLENLIQQ